jgi:hypothetical protein
MNTHTPTDHAWNQAGSLPAPAIEKSCFVRVFCESYHTGGESDGTFARFLEENGGMLGERDK